MKRVAIVYDDTLWASGHPPGHRMRPERLRNTWKMLQAYHSLEASHIRIVPPRFPTEDELATFHTREYIALVRRLSENKQVAGDRAAAHQANFGSADNPIFEGMYQSEGLKAGASLVGAELLIKDEVEVVFSFSGGHHHAGRNFASGFCVFGDIPMAIQPMLEAGWRVAYIDIDAHHGDGVQNAYYADPRVLTISIHESGQFLFPHSGFVNELGEGEGYGFNVNIPLYAYTGNNPFIWAFDQIVPPMLERFAPDVVVAQLGTDAHWDDPLSHLALTTHGFEALFQRIHRLSPRLLALGGGGYNGSVVPRVWTLAWSVLSEQSLANELPKAVASDYDLPFLRDRIMKVLTTEQNFLAQSEAEAVVQKLKKALQL